jgi:hypothetical protein
MKTTTSLMRYSTVLAALACFVFVSVADARRADPRTADLQVFVDVPPTWRPFLDDDIAEAFFYRLRETFERRGYKGNMVQVISREEIVRDVPALEIFLSEWRVDRSGNAQCTFTAGLKTPAGEKDLGFKTGTTMFWPRTGGRWTINRAYETADALEDAANNALRDLYAAIARTGLVAGLESKKR